MTRTPLSHGREGSPTEKSQNNNFSDTRQFSVPRNTTDSLREQINRANEQSLNRKRTAAENTSARPAQTGQNRPANTADNRNTAGIPAGTPASGARPAQTGRPVQTNRSGQAAQNGMTVQNSQISRSAQTVPQTGQARPVSGTRPAVQNPVSRNSAADAQVRPQRPAASAPVSVSGGQVQNTRAGQTNTGYAAASAASAASAAGSSAVRPAAQNRTGMPQAQNTVRPQNGTSAAARPNPATTAGRQTAGDGIPRNNAGQAVRPQAKPVRPTDGRAYGKADRFSQTKVTDISAIQKKTGPARQIRPKTPRFQSTEVVYEDEGGNTVISVVKAVIYMIFVVVVSVFLAIAIISVGNDVFAFVKNDVAVSVTIPEYATLDDVATILYENEIIAYPNVFKLYAQLKKDDGEFLAGDYNEITPMMNYDDLLDAFKEQPKVGISRITIPEGYTTDEIINLMVSYGIGTREGYEDAIQNYDFDYWFLDELEENGVDEDRIYRLDGYLFPDTYDFYNSSSEVQVLNKLLKRFGQIFTEEYKLQAEMMGYTVDDIISIAALIEKEAGAPAEFFNVSSVFHNRLNAPYNFPYLESDATIVYAIQHETGERPQLTETTYDTPYNTYLYKGLPPGPIANPSASAMLAALSPAATEYYFFVADGSRTYFSATKEQHNAYIQAIKDGTIVNYAAQVAAEQAE